LLWFLRLDDEEPSNGWLGGDGSRGRRKRHAPDLSMGAAEPSGTHMRTQHAGTQDSVRDPRTCAPFLLSAGEHRCPLTDMRLGSSNGQTVQHEGSEQVSETAGRVRLDEYVHEMKCK